MSKILIVDDDKATATLLRTLFEIEGMECAICSRADEVINDARRQKPDLLLMDAHLAEVDSLDILRDLKADSKLAAIPVVIVSGMDRSGEFIGVGAADFVLKPFKPAELMAVLKRHLR
ncbi:MAG TPA: response regulator [Anaerolineae bacterium]